MTTMTNISHDLAARALPTERVQNHASFLIDLPSGDVLCAWFAGTMEGKSDISIFMSRLPAGGSDWTEPVQLSDDPARSEQNPVLFLDPEGTLWLFYTAQPGGNQQEAVVRVRTSSDLGATWSPPRQLIEEQGIFVRQPIVTMADGRWLLPIFRCRAQGGEAWTGEHDDSAVLVSRDRGRSWETVAVPGSTGCVHMNILKLDEDRLVAFFRSRWADNVYVSRSDDGGRSWSAPEPSALPNNNSSVQAARLDDGSIAIVFNRASAADATGRRVSLYDELDEADTDPAPPATEGRAFWGAPRSPLSVALSRDDGQSWAEIVDIAESDGFCLSNDSAGGTNRELSYPSIIQSGDGMLHISYTHFRQTIRHLRLRKEELFSAPRRR
jgi:predicted neuraminidase